MDIRTIFYGRIKTDKVSPVPEAASSAASTPAPTPAPVPASTSAVKPTDPTAAIVNASAVSAPVPPADEPVVAASLAEEPAGAAVAAPSASAVPAEEQALTNPAQAAATESSVKSTSESVTPEEMGSRAELVQDRRAAELPPAGELIELNKSLREQIQILREERDWLRERIEKLEARSEREQMLLLSESENVRSLISTNNKPFWQRALPWFGSR